MYSFMCVGKSRQWGTVLLLNINNVCLSRMHRASENAPSAFRPESMLRNHLFLWGFMIARTDLPTNPMKDSRQAVNDLVTG